ncbi:MAG: polynucleotide adenylyltransferase [Verrucomicrobiota bacterium]|nr:polynucleotide adenylyltransferase [Verrucomicrobiota bacterium]
MIRSRLTLFHSLDGYSPANLILYQSMGLVNIDEELEQLLQQSPELAHAFLVGGCVRDALLSLPVKDIDIEVYGINYEKLVAALSRSGKTDLVGKSFGVVKLKTPSGRVYDFSIPRRDSKVAPGHKGFQIEFDPAITTSEAAARRDFTINSILYDPRKNLLIDHFGGADDLKNGILRHTSNAFAEDPLRVLRGMQLAARFNLTAAPETLRLCRTIVESYPQLALERVWEEWAKWAAKSRFPSRGLQFLLASGWITHYPELQALIGTPQDPEWHPEGDVFIHTCHCCDAMAALPEWQALEEHSRIYYMFATLCHDLGKPRTTFVAEKGGHDRIISPGHEKAGGPIAESFLSRINAPRELVEHVLPLVLNHMAHFQDPSDRAIRRLSKRLAPENIEGLTLLMTADSFGRPPLPPLLPSSIVKLKEKARELNVSTAAPAPLLLGRHLIERGIPPGPRIGQILDAAYEEQLEGQIASLEQALAWLDKKLKN